VGDASPGRLTMPSTFAVTANAVLGTSAVGPASSGVTFLGGNNPPLTIGSGVTRRTMKAFVTSIIAFFALLALPALTGCTVVAPEVGQQAVLVEKPVFFGHGGVDPTPVATGRTYAALSTDPIYVEMRPVQYDLKANDFMSSDGVPLDFDATVRLQVNDSVTLIRNFGVDWYRVNVEREFSNLLRQEVRQHTMNDTAISTTAVDTIDTTVGTGLATYLAKAKLPVTLINVTVGRALPPDAIKHQRIETAQQEQRVLTEGQTKLAEDARKAAEQSRADADNAYRNALGLSPQQFIQLETIHMQQAVCGPQKDGHPTPCTFILNGTNSSPILDARK
jgi:regulator of protease activity HflC (stomatin/prohibitin superfamily)